MAAIVCTPGGTSDNSYVSLVTADAYFLDTLNAEEWQEFGDEVKTRGLIQATRDLERLGGPKRTDTARRYRFAGVPYSDDQSLHFPRTGDVASDGSTLVVPRAVEEAVCEQAFWLVRREKSGTLINRDELRAAGVTSFSIDGLSESFGGATGVPSGIAPRAWPLIRPFVKQAFEVVAG